MKVWTIYALAILAWATTGCATRERYTSLDLDLLPCEVGGSPRFFQSMEFTADGAQRYPAQARSIERAFREREVTEVVVFVHGWNKNVASAEGDYQRFLCRLHGKIRDELPNAKAREGLLVIGVFWPSTISNKSSEPLILKPASYFRIRNRADHLARTGVPDFLNTLAASQRSAAPRSLQLIGHSFGGRIVVASLEELSRRKDLVPLLRTFESTNVVLLNAAVAPDRFLWIPKAIADASKAGSSARFTPSTRSYLFNVHSFNDSATRRLFPVASVFNDEPAVCAAGACGVPAFPTVSVDDTGGFQLSASTDCKVRGMNAWNVDGTKVIFNHTDIYKGRVAALLSKLMYDQNTQRQLPCGERSTLKGTEWTAPHSADR